MNSPFVKDLRSICIAPLLVLILTAAVARADRYSISWHTIDAGGGVASAGPYQLESTIGQHDAGWSSAGVYELLGGFRPGGPLCVVEFADFARFAEFWLQSESVADLDRDSNVDFMDVRVLADYWLRYCPYAWPLK